MWTEDPSDKDYLQWLRNEVRFAFLQSTGRKLRITQTNDNPYTTLLYDDMKKMLNLEGQAEKLPPGVKPFIKFFCTTLENLSPATIKSLEDYVFAVKKMLGNDRGFEFEPSLHQTAIKGVITIDSVFVEQFKSKPDFTYSNFYLGKKDYQWIGIIKNLDQPRGCHEQLIDTIKNSFDEYSEEKIAAIITGEHGVGKSTCLRRLSVSFLNEAFRVLWTNDPYDFCDSGLDQLKSSVDNYLVFIEDWGKIVADNHLKNKLITKIKNLDNVRIVISGQNSDIKEFEHLNENLVELSTLENNTILKKIIGLHGIWRDAATQWLSSEQITKVPLFIVLYVLNADSINEDGYVHEKNISFRFQKIIDYQLNKIHSENPGLAFALHFLALIHKKHNTYITYNSLLSIADFFNGDNKIEANSIEPLSNFIMVSDFINPDLIDHKFVSFHHFLLVNAIEKSFLTKHKSYDEGTVVKLVSMLLSEDHTQSALEIMDNTLSEKDIYFPEWNIKTANGLVVKMTFFRRIIRGFKYFMVSELLTLDRSIIYYYESARKNDEKFWAAAIDYIINLFRFSRRASIIILEQIVSNGCKEQILLNTLEFLKNHDLNKFTSYTQTLSNPYSREVLMKVHSNTRTL